MDIRVIIITLLLVPSTTYADIYKCEVNGKTIFSDKACSTAAKKVEINVYQPKVEDVKKIQQTTLGYEKDSRLDDVAALRKKNERLKAKVIRLQKKRKKELASFNDKIYAYSDTHVATREPGLFEKMHVISEEYKKKISVIEEQIKRNQIEIDNFQY